MCEARNASSAVTAQYFSLGEIAGGTNYYYTKDHQNSTREMTNSGGIIQAQYAFDPYGQMGKRPNYKVDKARNSNTLVIITMLRVV